MRHCRPWCKLHARSFSISHYPVFDGLRRPGFQRGIDHLIAIADQARREGSRHLALLTGVPGAGKTLVGLQFVYQHHFGADPDVTNRAVFLSGNGPLVEVLQHALGSRVFVQPMRNFIKQYGFGTGYPREHVLVFDEAQRAWDVDWVLKKHGHRESEPDLLIKVADRLPGWAMLVGLIGEGQEIHTGEEAGLAQWNEALVKSHEQWTVHTPPDLRRAFTVAGTVAVSPLLSLTSSLRTHLASDVQEWLRYLLMGEIDLAGRFAPRIRQEGFNMDVTRSLDAAKRYAWQRYTQQPEKRFGLLASSKANNLAKYGVLNDFQTTKRLKVGPWYNDQPGSALSCCQLEAVATEFACQGLELDLPVVCWGDDFWWGSGGWTSKKPFRTEARDPHQLRLNSYRVLLSRGRDGVVVFLPPEERLNGTYEVLLSAGMQVLPLAAEGYWAAR